MYTHILIATDGSELAAKAVTQGLDLAAALKARVTVVTVTSPYPMPPLYPTLPAEPLVEMHEKVTREGAHRILGSAGEAARAKGVACEGVHAESADPSDAIISTAEQKGCDLIVMASHGYSGLTRVVLGSVANKVLTHTRVPVLVCR